MARATAAETVERVDRLQAMLLEGTSNTECLGFARQTWGLSRAQGYKLFKRAWQQIKLDIIERHRSTRAAVVVNSDAYDCGREGQTEQSRQL